MPKAPDYYSAAPEALLVRLAQSGDRDAFAQLLQRRQVWIRRLMRRCSGDATLAEDLAQTVFVQAWRSIRQLQKPNRFAAWLKRLAINTWLQYSRRNDPLRHAEPQTEIGSNDTTGMAMDLTTALETLEPDVRLCIVLAYHERMTHPEISELSGLPLGTVKFARSNSRRSPKLLARSLTSITLSPSRGPGGI